MSYSSPLPPTVTPGWNDPPINLGAKTNGTGVLAQKYRRPVDPSIQVSPIIVAVFLSIKHHSRFVIPLHGTVHLFKSFFTIKVKGTATFLSSVLIFRQGLSIPSHRTKILLYNSLIIFKFIY